jgi:hypothetical protein
LYAATAAVTVGSVRGDKVMLPIGHTDNGGSGAPLPAAGRENSAAGGVGGA